MFKQAERLEEDEREELQEIVQEACAALTLHAQVEEQLFYPALQDAFDEDDQDLVREANVEHTSAKELIAKLEAMSPEDETYKATFKVLGEYVNHHIEEEEGEIFPKAKKAGVDTAAIGEQIKATKEAAGEGSDEEPDGGMQGRRSASNRGRDTEEASEEEDATEER
jgi:iron-sulfur cluster repair protein YtfE (RIC family)